jgi:hypothetical protein
MQLDRKKKRIEKYKFPYHLPPINEAETNLREGKYFMTLTNSEPPTPSNEEK